MKPEEPVNDKEERKEHQNKEFKDLMDLQNNVKIQPELFMKETIDAINTFKEEYNKVKENPGQKNERFTHLCSFLAHVSFHSSHTFEILKGRINAIFLFSEC